MSDSLRFDLTGVPLEQALAVALLGSPGGKVVGFSQGRTADGPRLVLYWSPDWPGFNPLPAPVQLDGAVLLVQAWLDSMPYGPEPDTDGHNRKGFRIFNEQWGHVNGRWQAFAAVEPCWLTFGK